MAGCVQLLLFLLSLLVLHPAEPSVFLSASKANKVLVRWKRAGSYLLEELFQGNLEKECYEEICAYEEAREVFEDDVITDGFWKKYMGGFPCLSQPCLNNGSCHDNIRSYTCTCSSGYEGRECAFAKNECHPLRTDGCQHFCHPGENAYMCSCAKGYKLGQDHKSCIPHEKCACGALDSACIVTMQKSKWNLQIFPWQVMNDRVQANLHKRRCWSSPANAYLQSLSPFKGTSGAIFICGSRVSTSGSWSYYLRGKTNRFQRKRLLWWRYNTGKFCADNSQVFTVAQKYQCENKTSKDPLTIKVKSIHVHMRYEEETGDNDISLLELELPIQCPDMGLPICMPESDFAEGNLIPRTQGLLIGWALNGSELGDALMQLPVTHMDSEECGSALNVTVTTRTYCERGAAAGGVQWVEGSVVAREHKGTWFLTGILCSAPTEEDSQEFLLTKVSRYSLWLRQIMK